MWLNIITFILSTLMLLSFNVSIIYMLYVTAYVIENDNSNDDDNNDDDGDDNDSDDIMLLKVQYLTKFSGCV